ncbi:MAG: hypothetical protein ACRCU0_00090 [Candidatus Rhabdochlamydia sp.]
MTDLTNITNYVEKLCNKVPLDIPYIIENPITKTIMGPTTLGNFSNEVILLCQMADIGYNIL